MRPESKFCTDINSFRGSRLWGEINTGVSAKINLNTTLYANASYQSRFDGGGFGCV